MIHPADPKVLATLLQRAKDLRIAGNMLGALPVWKAAHALAGESQSADDAQMLFILEETASCLEKLGRWGDSVYYWGLAFSLSLRTRGAHDECTATIARRTGVACLATQQRKRAIPYFESALAGARLHYGPFNVTTMFCIKFLARCFAADRQYAKVVELTRPVCDAFDAGERLASKYTRPIFHTLAQALTALGRHSEAVSYWRTYSMFCSWQRGDIDRVTLNALREWACSLLKAQRAPEAASVLRRCLEVCTQLHGVGHGQTRMFAQLLERALKRLPAAVAA